MSFSIGILSIQGDVHENYLSAQSAINELNIDGKVICVKSPEQISKLDGLILPGGESTTIGGLSLFNESFKIIKEKIQAGMPVLGICAGMILLSNNASDKLIGKTKQPLLDILDMKLTRNSFGRQQKSFEADISLEPIGIPKFNGVFIRAPSISDVGSGIEILSKWNDKIVAIKKDNIVCTAFHPELTRDTALHKYFVSLVYEKTGKN